MTRHGTLAYYLAAWIIGCPFVALFFWAIGVVQTGYAGASELFEICFFALMLGAAHSLLFAFLLRRAMHWIRVLSIAIWIPAGAVLGFGLIFGFAQAWYKLQDSSLSASSVSTILFAGPVAIWGSGWWQAPLEGAGIAAVLCLIDRAFNPAAAQPAPVRPAEGEAAKAPVT
jgi:hypothetical protein